MDNALRCALTCEVPADIVSLGSMTVKREKGLEPNFAVHVLQCSWARFQQQRVLGTMLRWHDKRPFNQEGPDSGHSGVFRLGFGNHGRIVAK
jgi:hypothetical protein